MSKEFFGDACAHCPDPAGGKARYIRIGVAFRDGERISIKIDTLPIAESTWTGWVNIFPRELSKDNPREKTPLQSMMDDDIPF